MAEPSLQLRLAQKLALAPQLAHPLSEANALLFAGPVHALRKEWQAALEVEEALAGLDRGAAPVGVVTNT